MWAQMITSRLKPGGEARLEEMLQELHAAEQPDTGLIRSLAMRDQKDPAVLHMLVIFTSEEAARVRESDPRRTDQLDKARAIMGEIFDGPPSFTDLTVVEDVAF
jgi:quinol monooxygenase YgiN